jgi:hypothetical protein
VDNRQFDDEYQRRCPDRINAEILTSRHVGLTHARLASLLAARRAELNSWMYTKKGKISLDQWVDLGERTLEFEEAYERVWQALLADPEPRRHLAELERVLQAAVDATTEMITEIGGKPGSLSSLG